MAVVELDTMPNSLCVLKHAYIQSQTQNEPVVLHQANVNLDGQSGNTADFLDATDFIFLVVGLCWTDFF